MKRTNANCSTTTITGTNAKQALPILNNFETRDVTEYDIYAVETYRNACTESDHFSRLIKEDKIRDETREKIGDTLMTSCEKSYDVPRRKSWFEENWASPRIKRNNHIIKVDESKEVDKHCDNWHTNYHSYATKQRRPEGYLFIANPERSMR